MLSFFLFPLFPKTRLSEIPETLQDPTLHHYNTLQHTATHCNTLQHTATQNVRSSPSLPFPPLFLHAKSVSILLGVVATCCDTVTRCDMLQHAVARRSTLQHSESQNVPIATSAKPSHTPHMCCVAVCGSVLQCVAVCCSVCYSHPNRQ